jgi:hypothetical protein
MSIYCLLRCISLKRVDRSTACFYRLNGLNACNCFKSLKRGNQPQRSTSSTVKLFPMTWTSILKRRGLYKISAHARFRRGTLLSLGTFESLNLGFRQIFSVENVDTPRALATAALRTSRTETMDFRSATGRFRVRGIHARELSTDQRLKYGKSLSYFS